MVLAGGRGVGQQHGGISEERRSPDGLHCRPEVSSRVVQVVSSGSVSAPLVDVAAYYSNKPFTTSVVDPPRGFKTC